MPNNMDVSAVSNILNATDRAIVTVNLCNPIGYMVRNQDYRYSSGSDYPGFRENAGMVFNTESAAKAHITRIVNGSYGKYRDIAVEDFSIMPVYIVVTTED